MPPRRRKRSARPLLDPVIIEADQEIVAVNKPTGWLSIPGRDDEPDIPAFLVRSIPELDGEHPVRVVHRLDRQASGVIVYARTIDAQRALTEQFAEHRVEKIYWALVHGMVPREGTVDAPLRADNEHRRVRIDLKRGKPSVTHYRPLEQFDGYTLVECRPETGRLHQIRVHLSSIGHPLAVDRLYGGGNALLLSRIKSGYRPSPHHEERPLIARVTLHALRLTIEWADRRRTFEAPLWKDMKAALTQLRLRAKRQR